MTMKNIVIGLLGTTLDNPGRSRNRLEKWRPTVDICRHKSLKVDRLELLHPPTWDRLAKTVKQDIEKLSPKTKVNLHPLDISNPWDFEETYSALYDFARGYKFKADKENYYMHITTGTHVAQICLFLLTESRHVPGKLVQSSPPSKGKPRSEPGTYSVIDLNLSQYDQLAKRFIAEKQESLAVLKSGIETRNKNFNQLIEQIERVAVASTEPMLLMGPTGAGKSQLASRIFDLKKARGHVKGDFVAVNCATLRGDNAMSALFGHVKGAYTGADKPRDGLLKTANDGCLFLDEIGELGLDEQAMLLSAIETGRYMPLGSDKEVSSDFQLIVGTNRDLGARVGEGFFRDDLLARINLWSFKLPGLAQRKEDIEPNLDYELNKWTEKKGERITMNTEAREKYLKFAKSRRATWQGNFRDLNASVIRMSTLAPQGRVDLDTVNEELKRLKSDWQMPEATRDESVLQSVFSPSTIESLDLFDQVQLEEVIRVCMDSSSMAEAGRTLFAQSRMQRATPNDSDRLRKYLQKFDLSWSDVKSA